MKTKLDIRICQINFEVDDIPAHVAKIKRLILEHREADLLVFPELILHGHPSYQKPEGYLFRQMKAVHRHLFRDIYQAVRHAGARVILGELKRRGDQYHNMATYVDGDGIQSYTKTHVHWTEHFTRGKGLKTFRTPFGPLGVNICYDSAFSEVWRALALMGAEVVVNISAVPAHFPVRYMERRLRGAAVFNQVFVVYANRPGPVFSGNSAVYDPRGEELARAGDGEEVIRAVIDMEDLRAWREEEVVFANRRPLLYREIANRNKFLPIGSEKRREGAA